MILVSPILMLSAQASAAQAQNRSVIGERFKISLTVRKNGDVDVVETRLIGFQDGLLHSGCRISCTKKSYTQDSSSTAPSRRVAPTPGVGLLEPFSPPLSACSRW